MKETYNYQKFPFDFYFTPKLWGVSIQISFGWAEDWHLMLVFGPICIVINTSRTFFDKRENRK